MVLGDDDFAKLVAEHHASLLRLASSFVKTRAQAEEVVQDTWVAVLDGIEQFEGRSSLKTWIFRILVNRASTKGARESREEPGHDDARFNLAGFWSDPPAAWDSPLESEFHRAQARAIVERALETLPDQQRAAILLRDVEDLDASEAAGILGVSEVNLRVLLHRGRAKLRRKLEEELA